MHIHIKINELLEERGISKNTICKDLNWHGGISIDTVVMIFKE